MYVWSRPAAGNPPMVSPPPTLTCWWPGHIRPSSNNRQNLICYTYMLASCHLYTTHMVPPCRVHWLCVLPIQYLSGSHLLGTIKISYPIYIYIYVLATYKYHLYTISMIPLWHPTHPTGGGIVGVSYTLQSNPKTHPNKEIGLVWDFLFFGWAQLDS